MRIFTDLITAIKEVERDLFEMGITVDSETVQDQKIEQTTLEMYGYSYMITNTDNTTDDQIMKSIEHFFHSLISKRIYDWLIADFSERIAAKYINPGRAWELRKDLWEKYIQNEKFSYSYNDRMRDQIPKIIGELTKHIHSRQAIITIYDKHHDIDNLGGIKRIPCSMHYQFLYRDNMLHLIYVMRSCDFLKHFVLDVCQAIFLLRHISKQINVKAGHFIHQIGSLHAFKSDLEERGIF